MSLATVVRGGFKTDHMRGCDPNSPLLNPPLDLPLSSKLKSFQKHFVFIKSLIKRRKISIKRKELETLNRERYNY